MKETKQVHGKSGRKRNNNTCHTVCVGQLVLAKCARVATATIAVTLLLSVQCGLNIFQLCCYVDVVLQCNTYCIVFDCVVEFILWIFKYVGILIDTRIICYDQISDAQSDI